MGLLHSFPQTSHVSSHSKYQFSQQLALLFQQVPTGYNNGYYMLPPRHKLSYHTNEHDVTLWKCQLSSPHAWTHRCIQFSNVNQTDSGEIKATFDCSLGLSAMDSYEITDINNLSQWLHFSCIKWIIHM